MVITLAQSRLRWDEAHERRARIDARVVQRRALTRYCNFSSEPLAMR